MPGIDPTIRRSPSALRSLLNRRARRQAETYSKAVRIKSLAEIEDLARHARLHLEQEEE